MALTQVSTGGIKDGQVHTADLADSQITAAKLHADALDHTYTLGADGNNHYTFTGEGLTGAVNDPTLYLTRGKTYRFVNGNSAGAHPFRIQTTVNGSAGTEYNTGVTNNGGAGGSTIIFEVPHDAPDVLYYQCTSHGSMGGILYMAGSTADGSITTAKIADQAVTLAKLPHGTSSNDGKFLRANNGADPSFETLTSVGGATGVDFNDNVKARFGTGNDLEIYHDGTDSIIKHQAAAGGDLILQSTDDDVFIKCNDDLIVNVQGGAENAIIARNNGEVELYHDASKKIETATYGTKTTGYHLQSAIPSFKAYGPASWTEFPNADTTYHPLVFANTAFNTGSHYSTSTGKFTAPVAGLYFFNVMFYCEALSETHDDNQWFSIELKKNGSTNFGGGEYFNLAGKGNRGDKAQTLHITAIEPLAASDEITLSCFNYFTTRWKWYGTYSTFKGYLIG